MHMCLCAVYQPISHTIFVCCFFFYFRVGVGVCPPLDMTPCDCRRGCCLLSAFVHFTAVLINAQQTGARNGNGNG